MLLIQRVICVPANYFRTHAPFHAKPQEQTDQWPFGRGTGSSATSITVHSTEAPRRYHCTIKKPVFTSSVVKPFGCFAFFRVCEYRLSVCRYFSNNHNYCMSKRREFSERTGTGETVPHRPHLGTDKCKQLSNWIGCCYKAFQILKTLTVV